MLCQRFQLSGSTVKNEIKKWKVTGTVDVKTRCGRPRKILETKGEGLREWLKTTYRSPPKTYKSILLLRLFLYTVQQYTQYTLHKTAVWEGDE